MSTTTRYDTTTVSNNNNNNDLEQQQQQLQMVKELIMKAKDIEQRLTSAIQVVQQQEQSSSSKNNKKGSSSSNNNNHHTMNKKHNEQQQSNNTNNNNTILYKNMNRYRIILCETYSDILLINPNIAIQYDIINLLWKHCFYTRIQPTRIRIQKEEKKLLNLLIHTTTSKQQQQQSSSNANSTAASSSTTAATTITMIRNSIYQQKESLYIFLQEGITLYNYLCHTLYEQLNVTIVQQQQQQQSTGSNGYLPCLYRLYIHLGDLYRYCGGLDIQQQPQQEQEQLNTNQDTTVSTTTTTTTYQSPLYYYNIAEQIYTHAMTIGPYYGHAFNQIAVIYQMKDTATTTNNSTGNNSSNSNHMITIIYWYIRSLGVIKEPFYTATSNLIRILDSNRQSMYNTNSNTSSSSSPSKQQQQQKSPSTTTTIRILTRPTTSTTTTNNNNNNNQSTINNSSSNKNIDTTTTTTTITDMSMEGVVPEILATTTTNTNTNTTNPKTTKVSSNNNSKTTSRTFLSNFIDIQYTFYLHHNINNNPDTGVATTTTTTTVPVSTTQVLLQQITDTMSYMKVLLQATTNTNKNKKSTDKNNNNSNKQSQQHSTLSDTLLCKLITIITYMEYQFHHHQTKNKKVDHSNNKKVDYHTITDSDDTTYKMIIRCMIYEIGILLCERVYDILQKKIKMVQQQQQQSSSSSTTMAKILMMMNRTSIRILIPLLLVIEYVLHNDYKYNINTGSNWFMLHTNTSDRNDDIQIQHEVQERYESAYTTFWKHVIGVYNQIQTLLLSVLYYDDNNEINIANYEQEQQTIALFLPREYHELRGYIVFESIFVSHVPPDHHNNNINNYINKSEQQQQTQKITNDGYISNEAAIQCISKFENDCINQATQRSQSSNNSTSNYTNNHNSNSGNRSVSSTGTNDTIRNSNDDKETIQKLQRFISLRSRIVSLLHNHVRIIPNVLQSNMPTLEWVDHTMDISNIYDNPLFPYDSGSPNICDEGDHVMTIINDENDNDNNRQVTDIRYDMDVLLDDRLTAKPSSIENNLPTTTSHILKYQTNDEDDDPNRPALLVPTNLLFDNNESTMFNATKKQSQHSSPSPSETFTTNAVLIDDILKFCNNGKVDGKGQTITPPPGFGEPGVATNRLGVHTTSLSGVNSNDNSLNIFNPDRVSYAYNTNNAINDYWQHSNSSTAMGNSMLMFGGQSALQTSNPFATAWPSTISNEADTTMIQNSNSTDNHFNEALITSTQEHSNNHDGNSLFQPSSTPYSTSSDIQLLIGGTSSTTSRNSNIDEVIYNNSNNTTLLDSVLLKNLLMQETTTGGKATIATSKTPFTE